MPQHAGELLSDFVREQLESEDKRRSSLEGRGASVITVSGTFVTLIFGVTAFVTGGAGLAVTQTVECLLRWTLVAFAGSSVIAIGTALPLATQIVDAHGLAAELPRTWGGSVEGAQKKITATRLEDFASIQRVNNVKAVLLSLAIVFQVAAVSLLAGTLWTLMR